MNVFDGSYYRTYKEACAALIQQQALEVNRECGGKYGVPSVWANSEWLKRQGNLGRRDYSVKGTLASTYLPRPTYLPLIAAEIRNVKILDFGGGSGWTYRVLQNLKSDIDFYKIVELESVIKEFSKKNSIKVSYLKILDIDDYFEPVDILYSNSTLQYNPNNKNILKVVKFACPKYILFDEFLLSTRSRDWFTIQQNSDLPVICRFISPKPLISNLLSLGYKLLWSNKYSGVGYSFPEMNNYPPSLQIDSALTLFFQKMQ